MKFTAALAALVALSMFAGCAAAPETSSSTSNASTTKAKKKAKTPAADEEDEDADDDTKASDTKAPATNTPGADADATPATPAEEPAEPIGPDATYATTKTATVPFNMTGFALNNGGGACGALTIANVAVKANVDGAGKVKSFTFTGNWNETRPNPCTGVDILPSGTVQFSFNAATPSDQAFKMLSTGTVKAEAIATVGVHDGTGRVTINFKRLDAPADARGYTFTEQFPLTSQ